MEMNKLPLHELFNQAADAMVIEDSLERIVRVNPRACSMFGYSESEMLQMKTSELEAAEIPIIPSHMIYSGEKSSNADVFTTMARRKDGSTFQIEVSISRIPIGTKYCFFSVIRDVSLLNRINQQFLETGLLYQKLVEDSLQGIAIVLMDPLRFAFVNYPLAGIFGFSVKEMNQMSEERITESIHPDDRKLVIRVFHDVIVHNQDRVRIEFRIQQPQGGHRWVGVFACFIEYESEPAVQIILIDITESKDTKRSLEQTRDQLQAILDAIPGAASWVNDDLIYLGMNKKLADLYEKPQSFFIGKKVGFFQPESEFFNFADRFFRGDRDSDFGEVQLFLREHSPHYLVFGQKYDQGRSAVFIAIDITQRKHIEAELRRSEERFKRLVEYNPGAIIVHCKGLIVYANDASLKMVEAKFESDVIGKPVLSFVHPDYRDMVIQRIHDTQETGIVVTPLEEKFLTLSGRAIDVEVTAIPTVFNDDPATQVIFWDITERNRNLESLRKSEALAKAIIEGSPTGVSVRSPKGRLLSVNDAWKRIWGIPAEDLLDDFVRQRKELKFDERDDYLKPYQEEVRKVYQNGGFLQIPEIRIKGTRKGSTKWISQYFYALTDDKGVVEQVVILTADITARKEATESLNRKDRILECVSDAATILLNTKVLANGLDESLARLGPGADVSRVYVFKNSASPDEEVTTSQISEWTENGVQPQIGNPELQNLKLSETGFSRWIEKLTNGEVVVGSVDEFPESERSFLQLQEIISILIVPIFVEKRWWGFIGFDDCRDRRIWSQAEIGALGSAAGIIGSTILRSIREEEIYRINEELEQRIASRTNDLQLTNQALAESLQTLRKTYAHLIQSEKMAALGNLVAGIAHEIKTPVGIGVTAASHLLEKTEEFLRAPGDPANKLSTIDQFTGVTHESARIILTNLQRASDLIQSFKQVAVDQGSEQKRVFYFREYLNSILLSLKPELKKIEHLDVRIDCPDSLHVFGYPGFYSQIISNLILNSIIHGFENRQHGVIQIKIGQTENRLTLIHEDDGHGIPEDNLNSIFEPFFTTKRGRGGTGLGLNLVYNLVTKNMKGTIRCESIVGQYTRFIMEVPLADN